MNIGLNGVPRLSRGSIWTEGETKESVHKGDHFWNVQVKVERQTVLFHVCTGFSDFRKDEGRSG